MRQILRRLPFFDTGTSVSVAGQSLSVRAYQIVLWVSVSAKGVADPALASAPFPVVLDTGNNHNFSIRQEHLVAWSNIEPATLPRLGQVDIGGDKLALLAANLWIHRNAPGERDRFAKGPPPLLELVDGIIVYPPGVPNPARLPTLGLRALVRHGLDLQVKGRDLTISLRA